MPKVLRILNRFNLGGPTYNAAYLTKYMAPEFETLLIGGEIDKSEDSSRFIINQLGIHALEIKRMRREINLANDFVAYNKIKNIIKRFKPDIVHTHASKAGMLGRTAAFSCNVPIVVHTFHGHVFHSYFKSYKSSFFINVEQRLAKRSTKIIAISDLQKYELSEVYKITTPDKIDVVPLGFDLDKFRLDMDKKRKKFRKDYLLDDNEIAVGIVGRLVPIKNHIHFLKAIKNLGEKTNKNVRAFIVGDGECRAMLENEAQNMNLNFVDFTREKRKAPLTFTSWIKNIDQVYAGIDIVALTSLNEGTPVSLIEAQAANKPIVSTNAGGIENTVIPNVTAFVTKNGCVDEFSQYLLDLIQDDHLRLKISQNGWNHVKEKFHYSRLVDDMKCLYYKLLAQ